MVTHSNIYEKICLANNGKSLIGHYTKDERVVINEMKTKGLVAMTSIAYGIDTHLKAVCIHPNNPYVDVHGYIK